MSGKKLWYSSHQMPKAIGQHGNNLYEREVLRLLFQKYIPACYRKNSLPHVIVELKFSEFKNLMGRNSYMNALKSLKERGIIQYTAKMGKPGGHNVSIITRPIVESIRAKHTCVEELVDE
ncbi:MAG: hypothetical protein J0L87_01455 [Bacteroidetes bacterium]|nr:hypothetical protein [Bacteroidota bacterium]